MKGLPTDTESTVHLSLLANFSSGIFNHWPNTKKLNCIGFDGNNTTTFICYQLLANALIFKLK